MKKLLLLFFVSAIFIGCNTNPNYEKNLATAQKLFELHGEEKLDEQLALVSKDMEIITPMYGSEPGNYDTYAAMLKGYQDGFEDILYTANVWLPGSNPEGKLDGSVRTYGTWTATNSLTGKELNLKGYWYFNFDEEGKVITQGDFFDYGGMINAFGSKNLVFIQVKVKKGKKQVISDILNGPDGIPTTAAFDGCLGYDMAWNEDSYSFHLVGNWESYEKYAAYLKWRQTEDSTIGTMVPFLRGGADGLVIYQPNSDYASF